MGACNVDVDLDWSTIKNVDLQFGDISPMFLCVSGMSPTTVGECEQADTGSVKL